MASGSRVQINTAAVLAAAQRAAVRATAGTAREIVDAVGPGLARATAPAVQGPRVSVTVTLRSAPGRAALTPGVPRPSSALPRPASSSAGSTGGRLEQQALDKARAVPRSRRLQRAALRAAAAQSPADGAAAPGRASGGTAPVAAASNPAALSGAVDRPAADALTRAAAKFAPALTAQFGAAFRLELHGALPKAGQHG